MSSDHDHDANDGLNTLEEDYYTFLNISRDVSTANAILISNCDLLNYLIAFDLFMLQATQDEINAAYRRSSRLFHPDKHTDQEKKKDAVIVFNKLKKAYEGNSNDC